MLAQFIVKRLLLSVPMLIGVTLVTFVVSHLIPADPLTAVLPERAANNPDIVAMYRARWGLDRPLPEQYLLYLRNLVHGDLGESYTTRRPVGTDLRLFFPATVELALADPRAPDVRLADYRAGKLQCTISGWTPDFLDPHGWAIPFGVPGEAAAKRVAYNNPQVAQLFQQAAKTADPKQRAQLYAQGQQLLNQDVPFICLYQPKAQVAVAKSVQGYVFDPVVQVPLGLVRKSS